MIRSTRRIPTLAHTPLPTTSPNPPPKEPVFPNGKFEEYPTDPASVDAGFGDYTRGGSSAT